MSIVTTCTYIHTYMNDRPDRAKHARRARTVVSSSERRVKLPPSGELVSGSDSCGGRGEGVPAPLASASETERGSELPPLPRRCGAWSEVAVAFHGYGRVGRSVGRSFVRSVGRPSGAWSSVHARDRAHVGVAPGITPSPHR